MQQDGESTAEIQEAIDTCPVDCIHWVCSFDYSSSFTVVLDIRVWILFCDNVLEGTVLP